MKVTKNVGKLIYWRGGTGNWRTGLIKNSETKTQQFHRETKWKFLEKEKQYQRFSVSSLK